MTTSDSTGQLILVTGPSGAGKDTLLDGLRKVLAEDDRVIFARRVITRPASAGGEEHTPVTPQEFLARKKAGEFWTEWNAHGLHYALPIELLQSLEKGNSVLANVSRTMTGTLALLWPETVVVEINAPQSLVDQRIKRRGRESSTEIQQRLRRTVAQSPKFVTVFKISNDVSVAEGVARFQQVVYSILGTQPNPDDIGTTTRQPLE